MSRSPKRRSSRRRNACRALRRHNAHQPTATPSVSRLFVGDRGAFDRQRRATKFWRVSCSAYEASREKQGLLVAKKDSARWLDVQRRVRRHRQHFASVSKIDDLVSASIFATAAAGRTYLGPVYRDRVTAHALLDVMGSASRDIAHYAGARARKNRGARSIADELGDTMLGTKAMEDLVEAQPARRSRESGPPQARLVLNFKAVFAIPCGPVSLDAAKRRACFAIFFDPSDPQSGCEPDDGVPKSRGRDRFEEDAENVVARQNITRAGAACFDRVNDTAYDGLRASTAVFSTTARIDPIFAMTSAYGDADRGVRIRP